MSAVTTGNDWKVYNDRGPYVYCDDHCCSVVGAITGTLDDSDFFGDRIFPRYVAASSDGAAGKDCSDHEFFGRSTLV